MALVQYATELQLATWLEVDDESSPDNAVALLRSATIAVAKACNRNPYNDTPTDTEAAPLGDATCAQVASWLALGVDPDKAGTDMPGPVKKSSILGGDVERDTTAAIKRLDELACDDLCDTAEAILLQAGLLWVPVPLSDSSGCLPSWGLSGACWPSAYGWPGGWEW